MPLKTDRRNFVERSAGGLCSGAPGSVGTTPIHPELGGEKAEGMTELDGQLSGIVLLVPESPFTFG